MFGKNQHAEVWNALKESDPAGVEKALRELLRTSVSFHDMTSEQSYHVWLLGLLACMRGYHMTSNAESGLGWYDIRFTPHVVSRPGILVKLKREKDASDSALERMAREALEQVREKDYAAMLRAAGARTVLVFGMAFTGKTVRVVSEQMDLAHCGTPRKR